MTRSTANTVSIRGTHSGTDRARLSKSTFRRQEGASTLSSSGQQTRHDPKRPAPEPKGVEANIPNVPADTPTRARRRWLIALGIALGWFIVLGLLATFTANPVTLNRDQILRSEVVVTGTVVDASQALVKVDQAWKGRDVPAELRIENLAVTGARANEQYIFPISISRTGERRYRVTESRLPNEAPLIYPATEEALAMLRGVLEVPAPRE
jgi:hypothetical protein